MSEIEASIPEKLRINAYSAIILDLLMPQLDGHGVLDFLKENNPADRLIVWCVARDRLSLISRRSD